MTSEHQFDYPIRARPDAPDLRSRARVAVALLPGALYLGALERFVGAWWSRTSDRVFRFLEVSAIFHVLAAPLTYRLWIDLIESGRAREGEASIATWAWLFAYVAIPLAIGALVGHAVRTALLDSLRYGTSPCPTCLGLLLLGAARWLDAAPPQEWCVDRRSICAA